MEFKPGDRVQVDDPGLRSLNEIMGYTEDEAPNNKGTVDFVHDDGTIVINFDDGVAAPYSADEIKVIA